jgi:hypothetical protein
MLMIVDEGKVRLLEEQIAALEVYQWGLASADTTIDRFTVFADLTECAFTGYARVTVGTLSAPVIVGTRAQTVPITQPSWTNGGGTDTDFFIWFLIDSTDDTLVSATNIGLTTIPAGLTWLLNAGITDTQQ